MLDGIDTCHKRTDGGLKACDSAQSFYKSLARQQRDYAKSLMKLAQSQRSAISKKSDLSSEYGSSATYWDTMLNSLEQFGQSLVTQADTIENEICKEVSVFVKEKSKARKKLESDGSKLQKDWKAQVDQLNKSRKKYVDACKDADKAAADHQKAMTDVNMKGSQLAKFAAKESQTKDKAAAAQNDYQNMLGVTNGKQDIYYIQDQPAHLNEIQRFEEDRISFMKSIAEKVSATIQNQPSDLGNCFSTIQNSASAITASTDVDAFASATATNVGPPGPIEFQPYDVAAPNLSANQNVKPPKGPKPAKKSGGGKGKYAPASGPADILTSKQWGLSAADSSLDPSAQQNKLHGQLAELDRGIEAETKAKDGLAALVQMYASDPTQAQLTQSKLNDSQNKIDNLYNTRQMVQGQLDQLSAGGSVSFGGGGGGYDAGGYGGGGYDTGAGGDDGSGFQIAGKFDYAATCDNELSFAADEMLTITEQDDSGWWYATNSQGQSGFVPSNYLNV